MKPAVSRREISPLLLAILTSVYFAAFCNAAFWSAILDGRRATAPSTWLLIVTTFFLIVGVSLLLLLPFAWRRVVKVAIAVMLVANALAIHFVSSFRVVIDSNMLRNAVETDRKEVADLLSFPLFRALLIYALVPGIALLWVRLRREPLRAAARRVLAAACIALAVVVISALASYRTYTSLLLYVSDHGESLGERGLYLHGLPYSVAPDTQTHVPMVLWMSAGFAGRLPIDRTTLIAEAESPLSHNNLFHAVLSSNVILASL